MRQDSDPATTLAQDTADRIAILRQHEGDEAVTEARIRLNSVGNIPPKYEERVKCLVPYLSPAAEWMQCMRVQHALLATRVEFGQAEERHLRELEEAMCYADPLNIALLETHVTKHDQLAVLKELGRNMSEETEALLHPGTTSYDVLDSARAVLYRTAWTEQVRPVIVGSIERLCEAAERYADVVRVGRTHIQHTSPVPFGHSLAGIALRLAQQLAECDRKFLGLKGKVSGIVGTGAWVEAVIGKGRGLEFEKRVLEKLGLEPDETSTQIVSPEYLLEAGKSLGTLYEILAKFANDMRLLYSSDVAEVTALDAKRRLGGSSTDAGKNNPIVWEQTAGILAMVRWQLMVGQAMMETDLERDLRNSVQARAFPQGLMALVFIGFQNFGRALREFHVINENVQKNLIPLRNAPSEAATTILRGTGWVHPETGEIGHDFVKRMMQERQRTWASLIETSLADAHFARLFATLHDDQKRILEGEMELYVGFSPQRTANNLMLARQLVQQ